MVFAMLASVATSGKPVVNHHGSCGYIHSEGGTSPDGGMIVLGKADRTLWQDGGAGKTSNAFSTADQCQLKVTEGHVSSSVGHAGCFGEREVASGLAGTGANLVR